MADKPEGNPVLTKLQTEYGPKDGKHVFTTLMKKGRPPKKMVGRTASRSRSR